MADKPECKGLELRGPTRWSLRVSEETVSFENYIANENLRQFTNKMLVLEQLQDLKGGNGIIFGYYLELPFSNQGSGMSCKLLIQSVNKSLTIANVYFGNKVGCRYVGNRSPSGKKT